MYVFNHIFKKNSYFSPPGGRKSTPRILSPQTVFINKTYFWKIIIHYISKLEFGPNFFTSSAIPHENISFFYAISPDKPYPNIRAHSLVAIHINHIFIQACFVGSCSPVCICIYFAIASYV